METKQLKEAIETLKIFIQQKPVSVISETIAMLQNEISYNEKMWFNTLDEVNAIIGEHENIAKSHNCIIQYNTFNIEDVNYLDVYVSKNNYKCTIFEASTKTKNTALKLTQVLKEELEGLVKEIDSLVQY